MNYDFTPAQLEKREPERFKRYRELLDFYHGRHWQTRAGRSEKQLTFNYAKTMIDKVSSYVISGMRPTAIRPAGFGESRAPGGGSRSRLAAYIY